MSEKEIKFFDGLMDKKSGAAHFEACLYTIASDMGYKSIDEMWIHVLNSSRNHPKNGYYEVLLPKLLKLISFNDWTDGMYSGRLILTLSNTNWRLNSISETDLPLIMDDYPCLVTLKITDLLCVQEIDHTMNESSNLFARFVSRIQESIKGYKKVFQDL